MTFRFPLFASVCALSVLGFGCVRVAPRIVRAPQPVAETPRVAEAPALTTAVAYVRLNGGSAMLFRGEEKKDAVENAEVATGDRIKVTNGAIFIVYPDAGMTRLEHGSDVTILSDTAARGILAELRLASGRVWTRFERVFGKDEQFSVAANGVVATVRGTAFGVSILGDEVDVQVAEHDVAVTPEIADVKEKPAVMMAKAGEGVKVHANATLKRALTDVERNSVGYRFALRKLTTEQLRRPQTPQKLFERAPVLTPKLERRQFFLRQTMLQRLETSGFVAPTRPVERREVAPGATPSQSFQGPSREGSTSTPIKREVQAGFVHAVRVIQFSQRPGFDGGLEIVLQDNSRMAIQARNALMEFRIGTLDVSLGGPLSDNNWSDGMSGKRVSFYLTQNQRAQLRGGEDVWVWYNSFESERYYFGKLDLSKLEG